MKTIKTSQVSASLLNRIVASINGYSIVNSDLYGVEILAFSGNLEVELDFCANWSDAGPILEDMRKIGTLSIGAIVEFTPNHDVQANVAYNMSSRYSGPTLEACMRCFVHQRFGEDVPENVYATIFGDR